MNDDLISRQAVIDYLESISNMDPKERGAIIFSVELLPSVQPKTGRWVYTPDSMGINYSCSLCGKKCYFAVQYDLLGNEYTFEYCPHCGTKMQSGCFKEES